MISCHLFTKLRGSLLGSLVWYEFCYQFPLLFALYVSFCASVTEGIFGRRVIWCSLVKASSAVPVGSSSSSSSSTTTSSPRSFVGPFSSVSPSGGSEGFGGARAAALAPRFPAHLDAFLLGSGAVGASSDGGKCCNLRRFRRRCRRRTW